MKRLRRTPPLSLFALVLLLAAPARAATAGLTVEGVISSVSGNRISIGDGLVVLDVTNAAIVSRANGATLGIAALVARIPIRATVGSRNPDGSLAATNVLVGDADTMEMKGPLDSVQVGSGTFGLLGLTLSVDSQTSFGGSTSRGPVHALSDLAPGDPVEVEAVRSGAGLVARRVQGEAEPAGPDEPVEFTGKVEMISAASWTISGKTVNVTGETEIDGNPMVGDTVEVRAVQAADGTLTALSIKAEEEPKEPQEVEFQGTIDMMSAGTWTISGKAVTVTTATEIDGTPAIGDTVEVRALLAADGTLTALRIKVEETSGGGGGDDHGGDDGGHGGGRH